MAYKPDEMLSTISKHPENLTKRETQFINDMIDRVNAGLRLSWKQGNWVYMIFQKI